MLTAIVIFLNVYFWSAIPLLHVQATFKGALNPNALAQVFFAFGYWRLILGLVSSALYLVTR